MQLDRQSFQLSTPPCQRDKLSLQGKPRETNEIVRTTSPVNKLRWATAGTLSSGCGFVVAKQIGLVNAMQPDRATADALLPEAPAFSVIVPTLGRPTLRRTLRSIKSQRGGDADVEVIVVADEGNDGAAVIFADEASDRPLWRLIEHKRTSGGYGYPQRARGIELASGRYLLFIDDDDVYTKRAFKAIRHAVALHPGRIIVLRMDIFGMLRWERRTPALEVNNVGMEMVAIPNIPGRVGTFRSPLRYASDFDFVAETVALQGEPVWRKEVIVIFNQDEALVRPRRTDAPSRFVYRLRRDLQRDGFVFFLRKSLRLRTRLRLARELLRGSR